MDFVTRHTQDLDDEGEITNGSNFLIILGQTVPVELTDPRGIRVQFDLPHETMKRYYAQFQTEVPYFKPRRVSKTTMYVYVSVDPIVYLGKPFWTVDISHAEV